MLLRANPGNNMPQKLDDLFKKHPTIPIQFLGIPSNGKGEMLNWKEQALWQ